MAKNQVLNAELDRQITELLKTLSRPQGKDGKDKVTLDERKQVLELAMKYEHLKIKAKGNNFGKGFDEEDDEGGGNEDF
jgi:hypothetical protein